MGGGGGVGMASVGQLANSSFLLFDAGLGASFFILRLGLPSMAATSRSPVHGRAPFLFPPPWFLPLGFLASWVRGLALHLVVYPQSPLPACVGRNGWLSAIRCGEGGGEGRNERKPFVVGAERAMATTPRKCAWPPRAPPGGHQDAMRTIWWWWWWFSCKNASLLHLLICPPPLPLHP